MKRVLKSSLSFILIFAIVVSLLPTITINTVASNKEIWDGTIADGFYTGTGTAEDPYIVSCAEELAYFSQAYNAGKLSADCKVLLCNDIWLNDITQEIENDLTASQIAGYNSWTPISCFTGEFNGNGYTIYGIVTSSVTLGGLFGKLDSHGLVYNLNIKNSYISASNAAGGITGYMNTVGNGVFNSSSNAYVKGSNYSGGISGYNNAGFIYACSFDGTSTSSKYAGGISGYFSQATMIYCWNKGAVYGENYSGGMCGNNGNSKIDECYNAGPISGGSQVDAISASGSDYSSTSYYIKEYYAKTRTSATGISLSAATYNSSYSNFDFVKIWTINDVMNDGLPYIRMQLYPVNWGVTSKFSDTDNDLEYPIYNEKTFSLLLKNWICTNRNVDVRDFDLSDDGLKEYLNKTIDIPAAESADRVYSIEGETTVKDVIAYLLFAENVQTYTNTVMSDVTQKISEKNSNRGYTSFLDFVKNFNTQYFAFQESWNGKDSFNKTLDVLELTSLAISYTKDKVKGYKYFATMYKMVQNESPKAYDDVKYYILSGGDTSYLNDYYSDSLKDISQIVKNGKSTISICRKYAYDGNVIGDIVYYSLDNLSYLASKRDSEVADSIKEVKKAWDSVDDYMGLVKAMVGGSLFSVASSSFALSTAYIEKIKSVYEGVSEIEAGWYALAYYYLGKNNPDALEGIFDKDTGDAVFSISKLMNFTIDYSDPIQRSLALYYENIAGKNYTYKPDEDFRLYLMNATGIIIKIESINCDEYQDMLVKYLNAEINLEKGACGSAIQVEATANNSSWGSVSGSGIYSFGDSITVTATPNDGAEFVGWVDKATGETLSVNKTYSFVVYNDSNIQAVFEIGELQPAEIPTILSQSTDVSYYAGVQANDLSVRASVSDGGTLSVSWYKNTTKSTAGSVCVGNSYSITPDTMQIGTYYYYPVIKNTVISPFDSNIKSTSVKKGSYVKVVIKNPAIVGINVSSLPIKTSYVLMEEFDATGLAVNLEYSNGEIHSLTDYKLSYDFSTPGEKQVSVSFMGFSKSFNVTVEKRYINDTTVNDIEKQIYSGEPCTPKPVILYDLTGEELIEGTDYTLSYSSNNDVGIGEITITGCGLYEGSRTIDFTIICQNHSYIEMVTKPTCFEQGYTTHTCTDCGEKYIDNYVDILEHSYTDYLYDGNGLMVATCDNGCGSSKTMDEVWVSLDEESKIAYISGRGVLTRTHIELFFDSISSVEGVVITDGVTDIDAYTFDGFENLKTIEMPDTLSSVGDYAFRNCLSLTNIVFPESICDFGKYVLQGCSSLEKLTIPFIGAECSDSTSGSAKRLLGYVFGDVEYENSVSVKQYYISILSKTYYLPLSLTEVTVLGGNLSYGAFYNCSGIEKVILGENVKYIGGSAFSGCTNLTSISFTNNVTNITSSAFKNCSGLKYVFYSGSESDWTNITISSGNTLLTDAAIHYNSTDHIYSTEWNIDEAPTCTEEGSKSHHCTAVGCDKKIDDTIIAATGHNYEITDVISAHPHITSYKCSLCDSTKTENATVSDCIECIYGEDTTIKETENTQIDYDNFLIFTGIKYSSDITEILGLSESATVVVTASHVSGEDELYGTGTIVSVFDGDKHIGDFSLIVEGDLNGDSVCDVLDASAAQIYSAGFHEPTENEIYAANGCITDEIDVMSYQSVVNMALAS